MEVEGETEHWPHVCFLRCKRRRKTRPPLALFCSRLSPPIVNTETNFPAFCCLHDVYSNFSSLSDLEYSATRCRVSRKFFLYFLVNILFSTPHSCIFHHKNHAHMYFQLKEHCLVPVMYWHYASDLSNVFFLLNNVGRHEVQYLVVWKGSACIKSSFQTYFIFWPGDGISRQTDKQINFWGV